MLMSRPSLQVISMCALVAASACEGSGGFETLPERLAAARCEGYSHCVDNNQHTILTTSCEDMWLTWSIGLVDRWTSAIDRGALEYDSGLMELCLDRLAAGHVCRVERAETFLQDDPACQAALRGLMANGESCGHGTECVPGSSCTGYVSVACGGTCIPYSPEGESCSYPGKQCEPGLICNGVPRRCARARGTGDPCLRPDMPCRPDLRCYGADADTGIVGTCGPLNGTANEGEPCEQASDCVDGLVCGVMDEVDAQSVCLARTGPGGPCYRSEPQSCAGGDTCVIEGDSVVGTCQPRHGEGEVCGGDGIRCQSRMSCEFEDPGDITGTRICIPYADLGESCGPPYFLRCLRGECSDSGDSRGTCTPYCT